MHAKTIKSLFLFGIFLCMGMGGVRAFSLGSLFNSANAGMNSLSAQSDGYMAKGFAAFNKFEQVKQGALAKAVEVQNAPRLKAEARMAAKKRYSKFRVDAQKALQAYLKTCEQLLMGGDGPAPVEKKPISAFDGEEEEIESAEKTADVTLFKKQIAKLKQLDRVVRVAFGRLFKVLDDPEHGVGTDKAGVKFKATQVRTPAPQWMPSYMRLKKVIMDAQLILFGLGDKFVGSMPDVELSPDMPIWQVMMSAPAKPTTQPQELAQYDAAKEQLTLAQQKMTYLVRMAIGARVYNVRLLDKLKKEQGAFFEKMDANFGIKESKKEAPSAPKTISAFDDEGEEDSTPPVETKKESPWQGFVLLRKNMHKAVQAALSFYGKVFGLKSSVKTIKVANKKIAESAWPSTYAGYKKELEEQFGMLVALKDSAIMKVAESKSSSAQSGSGEESEEFGDEAFGDDEFGDEAFGDEALGGQEGVAEEGASKEISLDDPVAAISAVQKALWTAHKKLIFLCSRAHNAAQRKKNDAKRSKKGALPGAGEVASAPVIEPPKEVAKSIVNASAQGAGTAVKAVLEPSEGQAEQGVGL